MIFKIIVSYDITYEDKDPCTDYIIMEARNFQEVMQRIEEAYAESLVDVKITFHSEDDPFIYLASEEDFNKIL